MGIACNHLRHYNYTHSLKYSQQVVWAVCRKKKTNVICIARGCCAAAIFHCIVSTFQCCRCKWNIEWKWHFLGTFNRSLRYFRCNIHIIFDIYLYAVYIIYSNSNFVLLSHLQLLLLLLEFYIYWLQGLSSLIKLIVCDMRGCLGKLLFLACIQYEKLSTFYALVIKLIHCTNANFIVYLFIKIQKITWTKIMNYNNFPPHYYVYYTKYLTHPFSSHFRSHSQY